jgi:selenocysteine-specific elongation factor
VLQVSPRRHRKADPAALAALAAKERGTPEDLVDTLLQAHPFGVNRRDVPGAAAISAEDATHALEALVASGAAISLGVDRFIGVAPLRAVGGRAAAVLSAYHERFPLRAGMPKEEFRAALGHNVDPRALAALAAYWSAAGTVIVEGATVRLGDFQVALTERQTALLDRIAEYYRQCGLAMPTIAEVVSAVNAPPDAVTALLRVGAERGLFHRVADDQYYDAETIARLQSLVADFIGEHGSITVSAFRDLTQSNRKFSLLLLEYFDQIRFTRRQGDDRVLGRTT